MVIVHRSLRMTIFKTAIVITTKRDMRIVFTSRFLNYRGLCVRTSFAHLKRVNVIEIRSIVSTKILVLNKIKVFLVSVMTYFKCS